MPGNRRRAAEYGRERSATDDVKLLLNGEIAAVVGSRQEAHIPADVTVGYAEYFDVALDYIFGRTDNPHGTHYEGEGGNRMKAVIYAPYSSDNQREESIKGQLRECTAFAEKNGIQNILNAIQMGILTKSTKSRLEELESSKEDLEIKIANEVI